MNIFEHIEAQAARVPTHPALISGQQMLTYRRLIDLSAFAVSRMVAAGVQPGSIVMISARMPAVNLALSMSVARLGAVGVSAPVGPKEVKVELIKRLGVQTYIGEGDSLLEEQFSLGIRVLSATDLLSQGGQPQAEVKTFKCEDDAAFRVSLSSGTTGVPKAMLWHHGAASRNLRATAEVYPLLPSDRALVFLDVGTHFGLNQSMRILAGGMTLVFPTSGEVKELARCIDYHGVTQVVTSTSLIGKLVEHVMREDGSAGGLRFPSLRRLIVGGEAVTPFVYENLRQRICANLFINYGSSEAGLLANVDPDLRARNPAASGRLVNGVQAEATGPDGQPLPTGEVGMLRFRTPAMAHCYLGDDALSARTFHDGWYQSRDMGSVDEDGVITLGARSDEMLVLDGKPVDPTTIEAVINKVPGIAESVVFTAPGADGMPVLYCMYSGPQEVPSAVVRQACLAEVGPVLTPRNLLQVPRLPRTERGKISRRELSARIKPAAPAQPFTGL